MASWEHDLRRDISRQPDGSLGRLMDQSLSKLNKVSQFSNYVYKLFRYAFGNKPGIQDESKCETEILQRWMRKDKTLGLLQREPEGVGNYIMNQILPTGVSQKLMFASMSGREAEFSRKNVILLRSELLENGKGKFTTKSCLTEDELRYV
ncbi:MAG: hypothetical protein GY816_17455, partial [Cytophagales bacterium]|nr:hypothetical protein [Cytophagales bacterium]